MASYLGDLDRLEAAVAALVRATLAARVGHALDRHRRDLAALDRALRATNHADAGPALRGVSTGARCSPPCPCG